MDIFYPFRSRVEALKRAAEEESRKAAEAETERQVDSNWIS